MTLSKRTREGRKRSKGEIVRVRNMEHLEHIRMRSSRRLQGLPPHAVPLPANAVYLPIEIRAIIVQFLDKKDLKQLRLVSNDWSFLATTPLFDRVFVSPHKKDLEIFNNVT